MSLPRWRGLLLISGLIGFARGRKIGQLGNPPRCPVRRPSRPISFVGAEKRRYDCDAVARNERDGSLFAPQLLPWLEGKGWLRETAFSAT